MDAALQFVLARFHFFSTPRIAKYTSFFAASSLGKLPEDLIRANVHNF